VSRYHELAAKVDGFFARVTSRHGDDMQCGSGCSDCCHVRLTVTHAEAAAIRAHVATLTPDQRRELTGGPVDRCAALDQNGRCRIYEARPFVCRTHGAPIRLTRQSLPVIESCFRNFGTTEPDPDCVLDQTTLSALTLAVDRAEGGDGTRVDLAELLASC
jgi:Fe-S-cluster containining protein